MALSTVTAGALVGAVGGPPMSNTKHVCVERAFFHGGRSHPIGTVLELPTALANELAASRKARIVPPPVTVVVEDPPPAVEDEVAPAPIKGKSNARK